jgi:uncharacterized protein YeaO (DUF488 family)
MSVRIVRLGSPRFPGEGTRIGTVRHPPRGLARAAWASGDWFDVWYPELAPSAALLREARGAGIAGAGSTGSGLASAGDAAWRRFERRYRREMAAPAARRTLELLAVLSRQAEFSVGCYCADASRCHRSVLGELLRAAGALVADAPPGLS